MAPPAILLLVQLSGEEAVSITPFYDER